MINKLTKQYRKGTLPSDFYYFKNFVGQTYVVDYHNVGLKGLSCVEVLSEVPSFEEFEKLKKQLDIAVKCLKEYASPEAWEDCTDENGVLYFKGLLCNEGHLNAVYALKKIKGEVK